MLDGPQKVWRKRMPDAQSTTPDALRMLRESHEKVRGSFAQYKTASDDSTRRQIIESTAVELELNMLLETELLYPAARRLTDDESAIDRGEEQHRAIQRLIEDIQAASDDAELFARLADVVPEHFDFEEAQVFPILRKLGDEELVSLGHKMIERADSAPREIRDHGPHAAASAQGAN